MTADEVFIKVTAKTMDDICSIERDLINMGGDLISVVNNSMYTAFVGTTNVGSYSFSIVDDDNKVEQLGKDLSKKYRGKVHFRPEYELHVTTDSNILYSKIILYLSIIEDKDRCLFYELNR